MSTFCGAIGTCCTVARRVHLFCCALTATRTETSTCCRRCLRERRAPRFPVRVCATAMRRLLRTVMTHTGLARRQRALRIEKGRRLDVQLTRFQPQVLGCEKVWRRTCAAGRYYCAPARHSLPSGRERRCVLTRGCVCRLWPRSDTPAAFLGMGVDHTIYATVPGFVQFRSETRHYVRPRSKQVKRLKPRQYISVVAENPNVLSRSERLAQQQQQADPAQQEAAAAQQQQQQQ